MKEEILPDDVFIEMSYEFLIFALCRDFSFHVESLVQSWLSFWLAYHKSFEAGYRLVFSISFF